MLLTAFIVCGVIGLVVTALDYWMFRDYER